MSMLKEIDRISRVWHAGEHGLVGVDATAVLLEDKDFEISGTSAQDSNCTYNAERGLTLTTSSAAADQVAMMPAAAADDISLFQEITWGTDRETRFEAVIVTDVLQATGIYVVGLLLTFPATFAEGDDADRVVFNYLQGTDTTWQIAVNIGSGDLTIDTGVVVTASTVYHFRIEINRSRQAYCYINDELVYVSTALTNAVDLLPCIAIEEGSTNPQVIHVQSVAMSRALGA